MFVMEPQFFSQPRMTAMQAATATFGIGAERPLRADFDAQASKFADLLRELVHT